MASFKLVLLFSLVNLVTTIADDQDDSLGFDCSGNETTHPNRAFQSNVKTLLSYLSSNATANKQFYNTTVASSRKQHDAVYGMFQCWGDVTPQECSYCVANATQSDIITDPKYQCFLSKSLMIWYKKCMIRYSNQSFFSTPDLGFPLMGCYSPVNAVLSVDNATLMDLLTHTMNEVANEAANSSIGAKKYATKETRISGFHTLFLQAQCTPDLSPQDCRKCLNVPIDTVQQYCQGYLEGKIDNPTCSIRYDVYPFYRPLTAPPPSQLIPVSVTNSDSHDAAYLSHNCSSNNMTKSGFMSDLRTLLFSLSSNVTTKSGFFKTTVNNTVSGLFLCRGDLTPMLCQQCVANATKKISSECPSSKEAIIWYNNCLLRYSNNISSLSNVDTSPTYHQLNTVNTNTSNPTLQQTFFTWTLSDTLSQVETQIRNDDGALKNYVTKSAKLNDHQTLYTLAQCTPDISMYECRVCLDNIFLNEIPWCCLASPEGKVVSPSCYIMFGLSQFYRDGDKVDVFRPASPPPTTRGQIPTPPSTTTTG